MGSEGHGAYQVRYLPLFWDDLNSAVTYIARVLQSPMAASRLLDRTETAILDHAQSPTMAPVYRTKRHHDQPHYWFPIGNYMVFYVVIGDVMEVRRLLYGTRDLTRMLP